MQIQCYARTKMYVSLCIQLDQYILECVYYPLTVIVYILSHNFGGYLKIHMHVLPNTLSFINAGTNETESATSSPSDLNGIYTYLSLTLKHLQSLPHIIIRIL